LNIIRQTLACFAALVLLAALSNPDHGSRAEAALHPADVIPAIQVIEPDGPSTGSRQYGAFGLIGVSSRAASRDDLMKFAQELAADGKFRELSVRLVSRSDWGLQFVYVGTDDDRQLFERLMKQLRQRFGQKSLTFVNGSATITSEPGARALGIVAFRPIE
jgi:hypothetical protein